MAEGARSGDIGLAAAKAANGRAFWPVRAGLLVRLAQGVRAEVAQQADRLFLWLVMAFTAGVVAFFTWTVDPPAWSGAGFIAVGILSFALRRRITPKVLGGPALAAALIMFGLGHCAGQLRTWIVDAPMLDHQIGPFQLRGEVLAADKRPEGNHVMLGHFTLPGFDLKDTPQAVRVTLPAGHGLPVVGSRIGVRVMLGPAGRPVAPGTFQFGRFLYFQGIGASGFAVGRWYPLSLPRDESWGDRFHAWTEGLRRTIGDRFVALVPAPHGAVAAALINGEQTAIPQTVQEDYRISGIAHILSVSGVHLSLLAGIVFFCVRRGLALFPAIALRIDTKKAAAWVGIAATGFYLVISGMSVPAIRSFLMVATVLFAILVDRRAMSMRNIGWAALILLVIYPDAIFGPSFQMSFLAVLALVAAYEQGWAHMSGRTADGRFHALRAGAVYFAGLVIADFVAGGATALFAAYHFNRLPTYSVFTNLVAAPLTSIWIMPSAILAMLLMPFGWDAWAVKLMGLGVTLLDDLAHWVASWPGGQIHMQPMPAPLMAAAAFGAVFICLWKGRLRWLGAAPIIFAFAWTLNVAVPDLLIDDSGRVAAVSDARGHLVIRPSRAGRFVREVWTSRYGASAASWPRVGRKGEPASDAALGLDCTATGCVFTRNDHRALILTKTDPAPDCTGVDLVVAAEDVCAGIRSVTPATLKRDGATAIWFEPGRLRTRTVTRADGARVWNKTKESASDDAANPTSE